MKEFDGFERVSSAPRLSFSSTDVFNLRNHKLCQMSRSSPGIYSSQKHGNESSKHNINLIAGKPPKSILIKPKEESIPEKLEEDGKERKKSYYALRLELQFSAFVFLCFILMIVTPLSMIIVGSIYINNCPAEVMIPIFLIVGGSAFIFSILLLKKFNKLAETSYEDETYYKRFFLATALFHIGWFIAGCFWVYGAYEPNFMDDGDPSYCDKTLYLFSFWFLNSIFLTLSLFAICFTIYIMFGRDHNQNIGVKV